MKGECLHNSNVMALLSLNNDRDGECLHFSNVMAL